MIEMTEMEFGKLSDGTWKYEIESLRENLFNCKIKREELQFKTNRLVAAAKQMIDHIGKVHHKNSWIDALDAFSNNSSVKMNDVTEVISRNRELAFKLRKNNPLSTSHDLAASGMEELANMLEVLMVLKGMK